MSLSNEEIYEILKKQQDKYLYYDEDIKLYVPIFWKNKLNKQEEVGKMVETQEELKLGIGTEEVATLKPAKVKITSIEVGEFGTKKAKKVVCSCAHPERTEPIKISAVKYEVKGKLDVSGLWINKDSKGLIKKGSALAVFLQTLGANTIADLKDKEAETTTDDKGYLVFKAY